ncbi:cupin-like domain-containing protein [Phthorimaea operculella]|nr:cupin-like domain-containing protein [Phthorimaea operculella]
MSTLNEEVVRSIVTKAGTPVIFRGFVKNWPLCKWDIEAWCAAFGDKEIPFRCMKKNIVSDEPCWERRCDEKTMTFKKFLDGLQNNEEWMYFDYKYLHQWFNGESEVCKGLSWKQFGYPSKGASDSTLWVGSSGAHTPCHQDTYGVNIVAQLHGKKRWILFPPETGGLKPTRVPYEESSVYSELNFYCPSSLDAFNGLTGGRLVELSAGDALLVPRGWWHYVQNTDPLNISLNMWLPHEKDSSAQVSEALIKILVAQICKDLPQETAKLIVNPNENRQETTDLAADIQKCTLKEPDVQKMDIQQRRSRKLTICDILLTDRHFSDDLQDTPLAVLFLQLETVANAHLDSRRKARRAKRQKTCDDDGTIAPSEDIDLKTLVENDANNLELAQSITSEDLINIIKGNLRVYSTAQVVDEDEFDGITSRLDLTKALIDAFSQNNVIELVKQNLLARMS